MNNSETFVPDKSNRSLYLDIVKGFAIILVVYGHCIDYYSDEYISGNLFYSDELHKIIYSFHMPLFMLVSGYLFYGSVVRHSWRHNLKTRFSKLLLPVVLWNTLYLAILNTVNLLNGKPVPWGEELLSYTSALWFLWAIFWCSLIVMAVSRWFHDNIAVYVALLCVMLFIPGLYGINMYVYMYPYFIVGYLWNKYRLHDKIKCRLNAYTRVMVFAFLFVLFVILYRQYTVEDYIYVSGSGILKGLSTSSPFIDYHLLSIDLYRYLIGFVGSAVAFIVIRFLFKWGDMTWGRVMAMLGQKSSGIYAISVILFNGFILPNLNFDTGINYGISGLETIVVLAITYIMTVLLERYSLTRKLLLGGR